MENLKKKSKMEFLNSKKFLKMNSKNSKNLIGISLNHFFVLLFVCVVMLTFGSISYANDTPPILQKLFDYADTYYNFDNTGKTDIISNELKSVLQLIHFNKNTYKAYYEQFANEDKYSDINACYLNMAKNGTMYLAFCYVPNTSGYNNYAYTEYSAIDGYTLPLYHYSWEERIRIYYNTLTNTYDEIDYLVGQGSTSLSGLNARNYNNWSSLVVIYNDNLYYCSNTGFDGFAKTLVTNSNSRLNGMVDFGFFNLDLQNDNNSVNFGNMFVGSGFVKSGFNVYLVNYDTGDILDNEIFTFGTGGLYNGRYIYQLVLEDFTGINRDTNYRLLCSTSDFDIKPFYSQSFKIDYNSVSGDIPTGTIIISGDYTGVGSGDGFNQAINDINNNLNVVNNNISNINNNIKGIGNYISDTTSPDNVVDEFFSGDNVQDLANKFGYVELTNNFYGWVSQTFDSVYNAINVDIPTYQYPGKEGESIELKIRNKTLIFYTEDFNPFHLNVYGLQFDEEQKWYAIRFLIGTFTNGICAYLMICWFAGFIIKLQSFNLNAVNDLDTDINLF